MSLTDFERVGGETSLAAVVDEFYQRVTTDEQVGHYFDGIAMSELKRHQALLLTKVLGGPDTYTGRPLDEAHASMGINGADYAVVGKHLTETLRDAGAPEDIIERVGQTLGAVQPAIVTA